MIVSILEIPPWTGVGVHGGVHIIITFHNNKYDCVDSGDTPMDWGRCPQN